MKIKELKYIIKYLPDDMEVGGSGHFGEFLDCNGISVDSIYYDWPRPGKKRGLRENILCISIQDPGPEPD